MVYVCDLCAFSASDKSNFNKHLKTTKHKKATGQDIPEKIYECVPCGFSTKNKKNFSLHILTQKHKGRELVPDSEKENFCALCDFQAKTPKGFASHKETKKHKKLVEDRTCITEEKIKELSEKISLCPPDKDIVSYLEVRVTKYGRTYTNATISYAVTTTNVNDEITLFEVYSNILDFLGVRVAEKEEGTFVVSWRRKKYEISRKDFLLFVFSTATAFDDRCKTLINVLYDSFRKSRWCTEPLKDRGFEVNGRKVSFRNARNEKTGDNVVVTASVDGLIKFSEESFRIFQRIKTGVKKKRLDEGFCTWWKQGENFEKELRMCREKCSFVEKNIPCLEHTVHREEGDVDEVRENGEPEYFFVRSVTEDQYISFLGNYAMSSPKEISDTAKTVVFIEKAIQCIIKGNVVNASAFDKEASFFSAVLEKKEIAKRNIILSFFGFEPRTRFSVSVVEKVKKLQE
ncbi:putative zinc finger protein [Melbournevirus]|uniref:putative zinc finger protein n=1 Tax=Melbournevirus TaxID=1560514 RepID=UPI00051F5203|nr:putative zinc finger protein [Melbournevirus]AIT54899.1 zinc finger protein [Melbournevirus]